MCLLAVVADVFRDGMDRSEERRRRRRGGGVIYHLEGVCDGALLLLLDWEIG